MRSGKRRGRLLLRCGLPEEAAAGSTRVTLFGRSAALVEGQRGVVEMSDMHIRLKTSEGVLAILGEGLKLRELSLDAAMIHGADLVSIGYEGR